MTYHALTIEDRGERVVGRCTQCPFFYRVNVFGSFADAEQRIRDEYRQAHDPVTRCNLEASGQHRWRNPGITGDASCRCGQRRTTLTTAQGDDDRECEDRWPFARLNVVAVGPGDHDGWGEDEVDLGS